MADFDTAEFRAARFTRSATDEICRTKLSRWLCADTTVLRLTRSFRRSLELVSDLESRQSQEAVVQRALAEVGEETSSILQRAHETADEIAARSRAQAEGRIQRAEREAELLRRQADAYSEKIIVDTRLLWEERQRLIEDIRQLADDVLGTAEDALDARRDASDAQRRAGRGRRHGERARPAERALSTRRRPRSSSTSSRAARPTTTTTEDERDA